METSKISLLNANTLELHYWFTDQSHSMDAEVQNKCERELLAIINEIAKSFNAEVVIETEPLADGGIKRWFTILLKKESTRVAFYTALITALVTGVIITPIGATLSEIGKQVIEKIFEDSEIKELEKEILKEKLNNLKEDTESKQLEQKKVDEEIKNLRLDSELKIQQISVNKVIPKKKSVFYDTLEKYPKINQISITVEDKAKKAVLDEKIIQRSKFKEFIIVSDSLNPIQDEEAIIEIISPVLKKGDYKWRGIYKGQDLLFNMQSNEFKTHVQTGDIEFKNGTSINCSLEMKRKLDNDGNEIIIERNIVRVNSYFVNETPIETSEGKRHRQKQEADKRQLKLFDN
ncbi:hypothetical protein FACS1894179_07950 [Bacteroidia bacterium]|nr:hypothetical protein FACS1894179_07950 [Bacteroidia bacterium]